VTGFVVRFAMNFPGRQTTVGVVVNAGVGTGVAVLEDGAGVGVLEVANGCVVAGSLRQMSDAIFLLRAVTCGRRHVQFKRHSNPFSHCVVHRAHCITLALSLPIQVLLT